MKTLLLSLLIISFSGCSSFINSATEKMANNVTLAMLNQDDPETVKQATPAYLIMLDSFIEGDPNNISMRLSAAKLYASYATALVKDEARSKKLVNKSIAHARHALCIELTALCHIEQTKLDQLAAEIHKVDKQYQATLYSFANSWASWIQVHSDDWNALAQIPKLTALFEHSITLDESYDQGGAFLYLGVLSSQIPPSLGGKPEQGRAYFEKALTLSENKNLMIKVKMAQHYARLIFDQELHDRLLNEVINSDPREPGMTLINTMAQSLATTLLAESDDFF